jgi:hypothetical protein
VNWAQRVRGKRGSTAYYIAPEQLRGQKDIDHRADQYATGVVLYELLTGEIPQGAVESPRQVRNTVPEGLSEAIMQALAGNPDARHRDMAGLQAALWDDGSRLRRRQRRWLAAAAVLLLLAGIGSFPAWRAPLGRWWLLQTAGEWKSRAETSRREAETAQKSWETAAAVLPTPLHPAEAADGAGKLSAGRQAEASYDFAAAVAAYEAATEQFSAANREAQATTAAQEKAATERSNCEKSQQAWLTACGELPPELHPAEAAQGIDLAAQAAEAEAAGRFTDAVRDYAESSRLSPAREEDRGTRSVDANRETDSRRRPGRSAARGRTATHTKTGPSDCCGPAPPAGNPPGSTPAGILSARRPFSPGQCQHHTPTGFLSGTPIEHRGRERNGSVHGLAGDALRRYRELGQAISQQPRTLVDLISDEIPVHGAGGLVPSESVWAVAWAARCGIHLRAVDKPALGQF